MRKGTLSAFALVALVVGGCADDKPAGSGADTTVAPDGAGDVVDDTQIADDTTPPPDDTTPPPDTAPPTDTTAPPADTIEPDVTVNDTLEPDDTVEPDVTPDDTSDPDAMSPDDVSDADVGPMAPSGTNCSEVVDCVNGCADETCGQACVAAGTPAAAAQLDDLTTCVFAACPNGDQACVNSTGAQECEAEWGTCLDGYSCLDAVSCVADCADDAACGLGCVAAASPEGATQLTALQDCIEAACPNGDSACTSQAQADGGACAAEDDACFPPEVSSPCAELIECLNGCAPDQACANSCAAASTTTAVAAYNALATCLQNACGLNDSACIANGQEPGGVCHDLLLACVEPVEEPAQTCGELFDCVAQCADDACIALCADGAASEPIAMVNALAVCLNTACPAGDPTCVANAQGPGGACVAEATACFDPPAQPTCAEVATCAGLCADQACFQSCIDQGSAATQQIFNDVAACLVNACPQGEVSCQTSAQQPGGACVAEAQACQADTGGSGAFMCIDVTTLTTCDDADATSCTCRVCDNDGVCTDDEDCVCPDCATDPFCAPSNCNNDGICNPYNEGCGCADCAGHPLCP